MRRRLMFSAVLALGLALALAVPAGAAEKDPIRVSGEGALLGTSGALAGTTAYLAVDTWSASGGAPGSPGYKPPGGTFTWTRAGVTRVYECDAVSGNSRGKAALHGVTADGLHGLYVVVEDGRPSPDVVRSGETGMLVTLWSVTSGDFRVR